MYGFVDQIKVHAPSEVQVEKVNETNLETYVDLFINGWAVNKELRNSLVDDYKWAMAQPDKRFNYFVAKINGRPAGTAGFVKKNRSAYLIGGNVLEDHRGHGVYKALIKARLDAISSLGLQLATTGTREKTSSPILEKLGFKTVYWDEIFQFDI